MCDFRLISMYWVTYVILQHKTSSWVTFFKIEVSVYLMALDKLSNRLKRKTLCVKIQMKKVPLSNILQASPMYGTKSLLTTKPGVSCK